jgi:hypothetical protein
MSDTGNLMFVIAFWTPFVLVAVSLNVVLCLGKRCYYNARDRQDAALLEARDRRQKEAATAEAASIASVKIDE